MAYFITTALNIDIIYKSKINLLENKQWKML